MGKGEGWDHEDTKRHEDAKREGARKSTVYNPPSAIPWPLQIFHRLKDYCAAHRWAGYEPHDALNSEWFRRTPFFRSPGLRLILLQLGRRSPWDLRTLFRVPRGQNPKALALFLAALVNEARGAKHRAQGTGHRAGDSVLRAPCSMLRPQGEELADLLLAQANRDFHGLAWGYHFDWQSKSFFLPRGTPTVVCTAYVAHALLEAWEVWGHEEWQEAALRAVDFVLSDLHRTEDETGVCFSYSPLDQECVYNASLLGAWLLARMGVLTGRQDWIHEAKRAFSFVVHRQKTDGSWFYGEAEHQRWIDNFHTGFILECLYEYGRLTGDGEYEEALARGVAFYEDQLFLRNGAPKYFPHRTYPIDIHACAQGILTFAKLGKREQAEKVLTWTLEHLWNPRGYFYYQKGRFFTNRIPYMRWGQAWMLYALSVYLFGAERRSSDG